MPRVVGMDTHAVFGALPENPGKAAKKKPNEGKRQKQSYRNHQATQTTALFAVSVQGGLAAEQEKGKNG